MALGVGGGGGAGAIRAGRAFVELFLNDARLTRSLRGLQQRFAGFSRSLAVAGGALAGLGGLGSLAGLTRVVDTLDDLSRMKAVADAFGITGEAASGLFGVLAAHGGDFKEDVEGLTQFSQRIRDALAGVGGPTGEAARLFDGLSVSAEDLEGVPLDEAFFRVHEAIRELPQELQAAKLALIGGTDSMKKWLPLLSRSTDELRAMSRELEVSNEDLETAKQTTKAYQSAVAAVTQVWRQVVVALAPTLKEIADALTPAARALAEFVRENKALVLGVAGAVAGAAALGVALLGLSAGFAALSFAAGAAASVLGALFSPAGLLIAGAAAAVAAVFAFTDAWSRLKAVFADTTADVLSGWGAITAALGAGDLTAALAVATAGANVIWSRFLLNLQEVWNDFKSFFVDGWHDAVYLFEQGVRDLSIAGLDLIRAFDGVGDGIAEALVLGLSAAEVVVRRTLGAILKLAETALGGTGNLVGAAVLRRAQDRIAAIPTAGGALGGALAAGRQQRDAGLEQARRNLEAAQLEHHRLFQREQAGRDESRAKDLAAARERLALAEREFGAAKAAAEQSALMARVRAAFRAAFRSGGAGGGGGKEGPLAQFATGGGSFGSTVGGRQFARTEGLLGKQLTKLDSIDNGIEQLNRKGAVVWGA